MQVHVLEKLQGQPEALQLHEVIEVPISVSLQFMLASCFQAMQCTVSAVLQSKRHQLNSSATRTEFAQSTSSILIQSAAEQEPMDVM